MKDTPELEWSPCQKVSTVTIIHACGRREGHTGPHECDGECISGRLCYYEWDNE